jgi:hypothetical protein
MREEAAPNPIGYGGRSGEGAKMDQGMVKLT